MYYIRVNEIEQLFQKAVELLNTGKMTTETLAKALGKSESTVRRMIRELRSRGFIIRAVHDTSGWRYETTILVDSITGNTILRLPGRIINSETISKS
jgi:predicted transcriptional regulator